MNSIEDGPAYCVSCLKQTTELKYDEDTTQSFKIILGTDMKALEDLSYFFCKQCRTHIKDYCTFRDICLNSIKFLKELKTQKLETVGEFLEINFEQDDQLLEYIKSESDEEETTIKPERNKVKPTRKPPVSEQKWCSLCSTYIGFHWIPHLIDSHLEELDFNEYKCRLCDKALKKPNITYHFEGHITLKDPVNCEICNKQFLSARSYRSHMDKHLFYECHHCEKKLSTRKLIQNHIQQVHFGAKRCYICAKIFHDEIEYWAHMKTEKQKKKVKKYVCDLCGYTVNGPEMMWHHKHRKHSTGEVICNVCGKSCADWVTYLAHRRYNHVEKTVECEFCDKKFQTKGLLTKHVKKKHEEGYVVACDVCGKNYNSKSIKKHKLFVHLKQANSRCTICDRAFKSTTLLKRHMFSHAEKRPYNCHICQTGYYRTDYLKNHYSKGHGLVYTNQEVLDNCIKLKLTSEVELQDKIN